VRGAVEVVDEDLPPDADLVAQQACMSQLGREGVVRADVLAGMRLPDIDEQPVDVPEPVGRVVEQRTLC
jgi:hypothetical protein